MIKSFLIITVLLFSYSVKAQVFTSNLPIVVINTNGETLEDDPKKLCAFGIIDNGSQVNTSTDSFNSFSGIAGVEIRGNSTQIFDKKSYAVQLWDSDSVKVPGSLLGMGKDEDWVLHAMHIDKSLLRIPMTFHLSEMMGQYTTKWRYVELVINDEYRGLYTLVEKIKQGPERVDISPIGTTDDTGGYILRIDWDEENGGFNSDYKSMAGSDMKFIYYYPKGKGMNATQKGNLKSSMRNFEDALFNDDFINPNGDSLRDLVDLKSFADFIIVNELSKNSDGYKLSSYVHKDSDLINSKWKAGPIWDFDQTYGASTVCSGDNYSGWTFLQNYDGCEDLNSMPMWYESLVSNPEFCQLLSDSWSTYRNSFLHLDSMNKWIDEHEQFIKTARERNFQKWDIIGEQIWIEPDGFPETYDGEITQLKTWTKNRFEWMDRNIDKLCNYMTVDERVKVYPNPTSGQLTIEVITGTHIAITDMAGRIIWNTGLVKESQYIIDVSTLAIGCYIIYSKSSRGTYSSKFVVQ